MLAPWCRWQNVTSWLATEIVLSCLLERVGAHSIGWVRLVTWLRCSVRCRLLPPLVIVLVASLLVAVPGGVGAVTDGQSGPPGSSRVPSTIRAEPLPLLTTPQPGSSFDLSSDLSSDSISLGEVSHLPESAVTANATRVRYGVDSLAPSTAGGGGGGGLVLVSAEDLGVL